MSNRVVIVGAGIVGLCTAFFLRQSGAEVLVIERNAPGRGASYGNTGAVSPGSVAPVGYPGIIRDIPKMLLAPKGPLRVTPRGLISRLDWLVRFLCASRRDAAARYATEIHPLLSQAIDMHRLLLTELGVPELFTKNGQLQLYPDRAAFEKDAFGWNLRRRHGVEFIELPREEFLQLEPEIGPAYQFGLFLPEQAMIVNPYRYCMHLAETLTRAKVSITQDEIVGLEFDGQRVVAAVGARGRYPCRAIVLCGGASSTQVLAPYGYKIPLTNQRGYSVTFQHPGVQPRRVVVAADRKVFLTPMEMGLRVGGTVEIVPLKDPPNMRRADYLSQHARAVFPALNATRSESWSGERPCLPDSLPVMGKSARHSNLWFNFGHGHLGVTCSAPAGHIVAQSLVSDTPHPLLRAFSYERFSQ